MPTSPGIVHKLGGRLLSELADRQNARRIRHLSSEIARHTSVDPAQPPVVFFRASTGLLQLSQNTAFPLLASWAVRLAGVPALHFYCHAGMSRCVQGTNRLNLNASPPCPACSAHSRNLLAHSPSREFAFRIDDDLAGCMQGLDIEALSSLEYRGVPLGRLVIPSARWVLRLHHIPDNEPARQILREYLLSAYRVYTEFNALLDRVTPRSLVVFNGMFFPEATARWAALQRSLRVITHEVGFHPLTAYFTDGEATAYPIHIPEEFQLNAGQNRRLDAYLQQRFKGNFTMAGIRFWPEMRGLDEALLQRIAQFKQLVSVFTNVVFDTSQVHANSVFPHMFAWLDQMLEIIRAYPDTLFVIRAHPDEMRPNKASQESVRDWVDRNGVRQLPNAIFVDSQEYISSYELIQCSKFVIVYNSSIGLEAALMGAPVLCGGRARYTQYPIVFFPQTQQEYQAKADELLNTGRINVPAEFRQNARRFLYYHLYKVSLPFDKFLDAHPRPGFVRLKDFPWQDCSPENSPTMRVVVEGILDQKTFVLEG